MADEKVIKIQASVTGDSGPSPQDILKAQVHADIERQRAEEAYRKSMLETFTVATEAWEKIKGDEKKTRAPGAGRPADPNRPPPAPKGRPGAPPLPGEGNEEEDPKAATSKLAKAFALLRKGVTALDGTNGKMTKALAFAHRSYEAFTNSTTKAASATGAAAKASQGAAAASTAASGAAATATKTLSTLAMGVGTAVAAIASFAIGLVATVVSLKLLSRVIESMQETVGEFSGALNAARAATEASMIQAKIRSSNKIGGELASLETSNNAIKTTLNDTWTEFVNLFSPFIKVVTDTLVNILKTINIILAVLNVISDLIEWGVERILEILSHIPGIGFFAKRALRWMQQDEVNSMNATDALNKHVENIFEPKAFGMDKADRKKVLGRFLP